MAIFLVNILHDVEVAYRRGDLFTKRRRIMQEWEDCVSREPA